MGNVALSSAAFPADACFGLTETQWNSLVALLSANFVRAGLGINVGNALPAPENEDKPWFRLNTDGTPDRVYTHINGLWLSRFFVDPPFTFWHTGTEASIDTLHGGEAGAVTAYTGPFWQKVAGWEGRSPMVPGTLTNGVVIAISADYGAAEFKLTALNLPSHFHDIIAKSTGKIEGGDGGWLIGTGAAASGTPARDLDPADPQRRVGRTENAGDLAADIDPVSNVHPVRGVWFLERTTRLHHRYPP